jgi:hypothetical protein
VLLGGTSGPAKQARCRGGDGVSLLRSGVLFFASARLSDGREVRGEKPSKREGHPVPTSLRVLLFPFPPFLFPLLFVFAHFLLPLRPQSVEFDSRKR